VLFSACGDINAFEERMTRMLEQQLDPIKQVCAERISATMVLLGLRKRRCVKLRRRSVFFLDRRKALRSCLERHLQRVHLSLTGEQITITEYVQ
jgi:hypothetical protein